MKHNQKSSLIYSWSYLFEIYDLSVFVLLSNPKYQINANKKK